MNRAMRNVRLLLRSEVMLAEHRLALAARKTGLLSVAALVAIFGLLMLDVALFFALAPTLGEPYAALTIAGANFVLAILLALAAKGVHEGAEVKPIEEVRDLALADLDDSAQELKADLSTIRNFASRPGETLLPTLIGPLVVAIVRALARKRG